MSKVIINMPMEWMNRKEISLKICENNKGIRLSEVFNGLALDYSRFRDVLVRNDIVGAHFNPFIKTPIIEPDYSRHLCNIVTEFFGTELSDDRVIVASAEHYMLCPGNYSMNKENAYMKNTVVSPKIADIDFFNEKDGLPTIKLTFTDGTHTTATCSKADISHFSFEQGVGICLGKKMLGPAYNRLIEKGCKMYFNKVEARQKAVDEERRQKDILAKKKAKRDARIARRKEKQRQEKIDILVEAIRKAKKPEINIDLFRYPPIDTPMPPYSEGSDIVENFAALGKAAEEAMQAQIGPFDKPTRKEKVLYLRQLGHTYKEIAKELGISKTTVGRIIRESNKD